MQKKCFLLVLLLAAVSYSWATPPNTFIATISGFNNPVDIAITPNNLYAYVTDGGSDSVLVIDTNPASLTFNTLIAAPSLVGVFDNPDDLAITPNGNFAYVCDSGSSSVLVINTNPTSSGFNTLVSAPGLSGTFDTPGSIAITPNGLYAYVADAGNNNVTVIDIDPTSSSYNTIISVPALEGVLISPFQIVIAPNGNYAYVSNLNGTITVIDTNPSSLTYNTVIAAPGLTAVNAQPEGLAVTANSLFMYVTDGGGLDVTLIDTNPASPTYNTVLSTPNLLTAFNYPNGVVATADGNYAYVTNYIGASPSNSSVSVIDTNPSSPTYNSTLATPGLTLNFLTRFVALAITPNEQYVYAIDAYNNTANVIYTGIVDAPTNVTGCKGQDIFLLQEDLYNQFSWSGPVTGFPPVSYNIYSNTGLTQLVGTVSGSGPLQYTAHNQTATGANTYYIVSIGASGASSAAAAVTATQECLPIKPKR